MFTVDIMISGHFLTPDLGGTVYVWILSMWTQDGMEIRQRFTKYSVFIYHNYQ